jgi:hypothetical protein
VTRYYILSLSFSPINTGIYMFVRCGSLSYLVSVYVLALHSKLMVVN